MQTVIRHRGNVQEARSRSSPFVGLTCVVGRTDDANPAPDVGSSLFVAGMGGLFKRQSGRGLDGNKEHTEGDPHK